MTNIRQSTLQKGNTKKIGRKIEIQLTKGDSQNKNSYEIIDESHPIAENVKINAQVYQNYDKLSCGRANFFYFTTSKTKKL